MFLFNEEVNILAGQMYLGFNPCFNGCSSSTCYFVVNSQYHYVVSILVLMDVPLQQILTCKTLTL